MKASVFCGLVLWAMLLSAADAENAPVLRSFGPLVYPPIAKAARVEGAVNLEFSLDQQGKVVSVSTLQGNALLAKPAESFVKTWQFSSGGRAGSYRTTIDFKLTPGFFDSRVSSALTVHNDSFRRFEVIAEVGLSEVSHCPASEDEKAPAVITPSDYVELSRSGCYGSCPAYSIKVRADGALEWNGSAFVAAEGRRTGHIDASAARALIESFRTREFWSLCGEYTRSVTDNATVTVAATIAGRTRVVSDYADSAPPAQQSRELLIDEVSNSHYWRHGDPANEPITLISADAYLPKPGVTPLIRAAAHADVEELKRLLRTKVNVNETDASGWSALMYAAASGHLEPVQLLLRAGANPNRASIRGDTPLIASASRGEWDTDLVRAGARVNWRNKDGQTALMFLADRAAADELRDALKAGANPALKDGNGKTAADYLHQASCGKSLLANPLTRFMATTYRTCNALNADDVRASNKLLSQASRRLP